MLIFLSLSMIFYRMMPYSAEYYTVEQISHLQLNENNHRCYSEILSIVQRFFGRKNFQKFIIKHLFCNQSLRYPKLFQKTQ